MRVALAVVITLPLTACLDAEPRSVDDCSDGSIAGSVYAETQENVDALAGCHTIAGSLYLWGDAVTSVAPLANLQRIDGTLSILSTRVADLSPFAQLHTVEGCLEIRDNPALATLEGLDGLTAVEGCLSIGTSSSVDGVPFGNPALRNIDALSAVERIGGFVTIENNDQLEHVDGLASVARIGGDLRIATNPSLRSVSGLLGLDDFGGQSVAIANNPMLPACEAEQLAGALGSNQAETHGNNSQAACD